jgi:hypothetical protein
MQLRDGLLSAFIRRHFNETEATGSSSRHVAHDGDRFHRRDALEQFL